MASLSRPNTEWEFVYLEGCYGRQHRCHFYKSFSKVQIRETASQVDGLVMVLFHFHFIFSFFTHFVIRGR
jgi:hypothetical protein